MLGSVDEAAGWRTRSSPVGGGGVVMMGGVGILQLMAPSQAKLVPVLGKKTGWDVGHVNKREECASLENEWVTVAGKYVCFFLFWWGL